MLSCSAVFNLIGRYVFCRATSACKFDLRLRLVMLRAVILQCVRTFVALLILGNVLLNCYLFSWWLMFCVSALTAEIHCIEHNPKLVHNLCTRPCCCGYVLLAMVCLTSRTLRSCGAGLSYHRRILVNILQFKKYVFITKVNL